MADKDNLIKIILEMVQKGTGAKDTRSDIEKLEEAVEATEEVVRGMRDEMAKLDTETRKAGKQAKAYADHLSNITKEGRAYLEAAKAMAAAETKVGYANKDLGTGIYDTSGKVKEAKRAVDDLNEELREQQQVTDDSVRSIDKIGRELDEARAALYKMEVGTENFNEQQKKVATLSRERLTAEKAAAKGTRNAGNAILFASQGLEDMQYGLRGVQNNIPPLLLAMGAGAGLAGVIQILIVGLGVLIPLLIGSGDAAERAARVTEIASERKLEAARKERALSRELEQQRVLLDLAAQEQVDTLLREVSAYDELTEAIQRNYAQAQAVANEKLALDIALVQNDSSLSDLEKVVKIDQLKVAAARQAEQQKLNELSAEAVVLEQKTSQSKQEVGELIYESQRRQINFNREIEIGTRKVEDLKANYDELLSRFQKGTIKGVDDLDSFFQSGKFGGNTDRDDFGEGLPGDKAFLEQARVETYGEEQALVDSAIRQYELLERTQAIILEQEEKLKDLRRDQSSSKSRDKSAIDTLNATVEAGEKTLETLNRELEAEKELIALREQRRQVESAGTGAKASVSEIQKEVSELNRDLDADLTEAGATKEEIAAAKEKVAAISKTVTEALKDGVIDTQEFNKISTGIGELRSSLTAQADATNQNIVDLLAAVRAQQQFQQQLQLQIRQNQIPAVSP